jgi:hypothetical protein
MTEAGALELLVNQQVIAAMKAHDAVRTTTLRLIKNSLKNKAIEKRALLTAAEATEVGVIEEFLPKALDQGALEVLVAEAVQEAAVASGQKPTPKDMGTVMKTVQAKLQASGLRAEGRTVSELVKKVLAG